MARCNQKTLGELVNSALDEVSRAGRVNGRVECETYGRQTSDDRPFAWTYKITGAKTMEARESGNDYDEPEEKPMSERALEYLKSAIDEANKNKKLSNIQFKGNPRDKYSGLFIITGDITAQAPNPAPANTQNTLTKEQQEFLKLGRGTYNPSQSYGLRADTKRVLMEKYFPGRFGVNGSQRASYSKLTDTQIGYLFNQLYKQYSVKAKAAKA